ncbi:MAG: hypothetical protein V4596_11035 [Bdellovibrionota bacterium]
MKTLLTLSLVIGLSIQANAGEDRGGGDPCESRIKVISQDIKSWILKGGAKGLTLPANISVETYSNSIISQINTAQVTCVDEKDSGYPVQVSGEPKVCRFDRNDDKSKITCDIRKFQALNEKEQYELIHHEYAGLAGIENPEGANSKYEISNQISEYLVDVVVKKLAVKTKLTSPVYKGSFEQLKEQCQIEETLNYVHEQIKLKEINRVNSILNKAGIGVKHTSLVLSPILGCYIGMYKAHDIKPQHMAISVVTSDGSLLGAEQCMGTIDPQFVVKSNSVGHPVSVSCTVPFSASGSRPYKLYNLKYGAQVVIKNEKSDYPFGGRNDEIAIFKDIKVQN